MSVDPSDDCTFWYTTEYLQADGTFNWSTRIGSFKFASCGSITPPAADFAFVATPVSRSIQQGQPTTFDVTVTAQNGYTGSGSYSVSGLPAGTTGAFSPSGYGGGAGTSTLTITTSGSTPTGSFPVTITATDSSSTPSHSATVTLTVTAVPAADFSIDASPGTRVIKRGDSGAYSITVTPSGGFNETVTFSVSGLPSDASASFSPASVPGSGSSTLTIQTANPPGSRGTYTLTITGTSASKTRSTTVTLKIQ
jgi:serine protease AprX